VSAVVEPRLLSAVEVARSLGLEHAPTPEQARVIEAPLRAHLVVAGAGSGKTETMAARVVWLVANGLAAPDQVLGLTFTRKAAGELAERIGRRLRALRASGVRGAGGAGEIPGGGGVQAPVVSTYNAYAASLVADHGLRLGIEPGARLLGEAAGWQLALEVVQGWDPPVGTAGLAVLDRALDTLVAAVLALAGQCSEHLCDPEQVLDLTEELTRYVALLPKDDAGGAPARPAKSSDVTKVLASLRARAALVPVVRTYQARKRELEALDFGDQVAMAARLARIPEVAAGERERFGVVLLDEYQDTSHAQLELLTALFDDGHPVTAVGDPNQSIYGWRGASAGNLDNFPTQFACATNGSAEVLALSTSWRSPRVVLDVANTVAGPLREVSQVPVQPLRARDDAPVGAIRVAWHETVEQEAADLADQLALHWRDPAVGTVAVLCRQRSQFQPIEKALRARGLPVEVVGLGGLLDRPEVGDVVATLRVLHDPSRGDALMRLLTGPRWRIGPRDLAGLGSWSRMLASRDGVRPGGPGEQAVLDPDVVDESSIVDALDELPPPGWAPATGPGLSGDGRARLHRLATELSRLRGRTSLPLPELVAEVERALLLEVELSSAPGVVASTARAQLDAFADVAVGFADTSDRATLGGFLSWLTAAASRERGLEQGEDQSADADAGSHIGEHVTQSTTAIQVLTVHAAKGLEWDVVAVPGMVEGRFPSGRQSGGTDSASGWPTTTEALPYPLRGDAGSLPVWHWRSACDLKELGESLVSFRRECGAHEVLEERRLAYVAWTRPKQTLLVSGFWWDHTSTARKPSRFVRQLVHAHQGDPALQLVGADPGDLEQGSSFDQHPGQGQELSHAWPVDPLGERREALASAARQVLAHQHGPLGSRGACDVDPGSPLALEIDRLLHERDTLRSNRSQVVLPSHLSASRAVQLAADPAAFASALRRPVPAQPRPATRRGTAFHEWIERQLRSEALWDLADVAGAGDDEAAQDAGLALLQQQYLASEWAQREVVAVEVDVETAVHGTVLRGRIDAVFGCTRPDGQPGFDVVDWKTGSPPTGAALRAAAIQLAVYRLAWARLQGLPPERVGAAFFYVGAGMTLRPADDLDEQALTDLVESVPLQG